MQCSALGTKAPRRMQVAFLCHLAVNRRKMEREVTDFLEALWVEAWGTFALCRVDLETCGSGEHVYT